MTTATITRRVIDTRPATTTSIAISEVRHAVRLALAATNTLGLDDPLWDELAPYADEFAQVLGQALGEAAVPTSRVATHASRMRALIIAARRAVRRDAGIVDGAAAVRATQLAEVIAHAGVTGVVRAPR